MIKLSKDTKFVEVAEEIAKQPTTKKPPAQPHNGSAIRPDVVDAKVYKLKSAFVKNSVFITLSYINYNGQIRPIEIFINSKDLTRAPEYVVLTRLISAIFRRATDPMFILEELQGIFDPNGGSFKEGKYYHSFYAEIADVIERFFYDVKIVARPDEMPVQDNGEGPSEISQSNDGDVEENSVFRICPECNERTLKTENGCDSCVAAKCGYSKCDK
jgi:ribonucleoside-diphosphate reductase alpha chain